MKKHLFNKLSQITSGYYNLFFGKLKIKLLGRHRMKICNNCPINVNNFCSEALGGCGCYLKAKVVCPHCNCPKGKWKAEKI